MRYGLGRAIAALLLFCSALASAEVAVPELRARVTDLTGTLSAPQSAALEQKLAAFEQGKGSQIAVLIVPTTQPEEVEQYSLRVVEQWKLGRKKIDDGALLLIAKQDRALRIEVGYGLEGALPDAIAKRIIAETITPYFKQGDFYGGIDAGVSQMIQVLEGEILPPPQKQVQISGDPLGLLFFPFFILYAIGQGLRRMVGSLPASALVGAGTGFVASLLIGSTVLGVGAGVIATIMALLLYSGAAGALPFNMGHGGARGGGFGGGGFGGGGGGFGGGGASGAGDMKTLQRLWIHACTGRLALRRNFPPAALAAIERAVKECESRHPGEIRFALEPALSLAAVARGVTPRERATQVFSDLRVWDTAHNNGVLIYVLLADHAVEIVADRGVGRERVPQAEWDAVCRLMEDRFRRGAFGEGGMAGVAAVAAVLAKYPPAQPDAGNEFPDAPVLLR